MSSLAQIVKDKLELTLSESQIAAFETYADTLLEWSARTNLTAITDPAGIDLRHFADSLSVLSVMGERRHGLRVIDVGTGAGFPGLPLKIVRPDIELTLVEATGKKTAFLEHVVGLLGLSGVAVVNERAETIGQDSAHREQYDLVLARAVAGLPTLLEYLLPLCKLGGQCVAQKGETAPREAADSALAMSELGGQMAAVQPVDLPGIAEARYLIVVKKVAPTPAKYPRRPGMPAKRPLS